MKDRRLYALAALAFVVACQDQKVPTAPGARNVPANPAGVILDGAHSGNPDFFFLPPMVPDPSSNSNFVQGTFNAFLQPSLTVEICQLQDTPVDGQGLPLAATLCVDGLPLKKFPAGTVMLQQTDPGGYYMVVWNTQQSNLDVTKYYRIKVLIEGATVPFGVADIDPVSNMKEFKNVRTGEVIPLNDDSSLPIKFRVERGAACNGGLCNSVTVGNNSPTGSTIVTLDEGAGAVAGAKFPNGWLPSAGPQSVVVTIADVNTGVSDPTTLTETIPCHANLPLQQFRGCFNFSTTPPLTPINDAGTQFAIPVTVAVCYVLQGTGDTREKFAEMWASGPKEQPHALPDTSDAGILSPAARSCATNLSLNSSRGVTGLASAGWRKLKGGLGRIFGVQTAYAVDLGLGGSIDGFSNVGPALSAHIQPVGATELTVPGGGTVTPFVRVVGSNHHDGEHQNSIGIGGSPVKFVPSAGSIISLQGTGGGDATPLTVNTSTLPIDGSPTSGGGYAAVNWTIPNTPGMSYMLTVNGLTATGGPVTFTATVPQLRGMLSMQTGATLQLASTSPVATWTSSDATRLLVSSTGLVTAVIGGENIDADAPASITSVLTTGAAGPSFLANSFSFNIFPRITTLAWNAIPGAVSYRVVTDYGNPCSVPAACTVWAELVSTTTTALTYTFGFVGEQPGRWRVFALDATGAVIGNPSPYVYFAYII